MTEKRFTITPDFEEHHRQIRDNGHIIMGCFVEPQAEVIVGLLNQLYDENEQLKKTNQGLYDELQETMGYLSLKTGVEKENEQLKQLVDEAEDIIICQCTPYYQRIWENIKKNIKGDME